LSSNSLKELQKTLRNVELKKVNVVVMPDFFLDRFISLNCTVKEFFSSLKEVAERKGGSIDNIEQMEIRGGNAVNTASALAALGVKVTPIICTSKLGLKLIKFYLKRKLVNLSHIKIFDKPSITTALEFKSKEGKTNIMLRDVGSLAEFGPQHLSNDDFEVIKKADYVCIFNWAGTRKLGTELAEKVFKLTKTEGKGKTYYDAADPSPNKEKIPKLANKVLKSKFLDVLSLNENEAIWFASEFDNEAKMFRTKPSEVSQLAVECARILASHIHARVDLHTTEFSMTFLKNNEVKVSAFNVPVLRVTGAGDAWNAGNILGDMLKLPDEYRLILANAVAALYISNSDGRHPTKNQLIKFLEKQMKRCKK